MKVMWIHDLEAYLKSYDPDANNGRGWVETTLFLDDAMPFETHGEAQALWAKVSTTRPVREDGRPNRPLSAYTVTIT